MGQVAPDKRYYITVLCQRTANTLHALIKTKIIGDGKNQVDGSGQAVLLEAKVTKWTMVYGV